MKRVLILALVHAGAALAEPPKPQDFAYGFSLSVAEEAPLYSLTLPEAVYLQSVQPQLGDLRVFNAQNQPVPHALRQPPVADQSDRHPVPVFPLPAEADAADLAVRVQTDQHGAVIAVSPAAGARTVPGGYLLDLSRLPRPAERLHLSWAAAEGFVSGVRLAVSDDLTDWRPLGSATVAELSYDGHRLRRDSIELPRVQARYLRLQLEADAPAIAAAQAEVREAGEAPWLWRSAELAQAAPDALVFDAGGQLPAQRLDLSFALPNQLVSVRVSSAQSPEGPWRLRHTGAFYRLKLGETELRGTPVELGRVNERYWRLEPVDPGADLAASPPQLRLGWQPQELVFVAQGAGPYLLAYGSGQVEASGSALPQLLRDLQSNRALIRPATLEDKRVLGGAEALLPPRAPLPWRKWLLWAVLVIAAAALGFMAWKLAREMGRPST